ncbi:hypothetical protein [Microbulbifer sp. SAOS-129_SWC]|uniref:hypothetical protein n=1 Tax=Microbulbifer sp. SAOS-129_SWC TaxID=3145235 RepID=UPI00321642FA
MNATQKLTQKTWLLGLVFLLALAASDNWQSPRTPAAAGSHPFAAPVSTAATRGVRS